MKTLIMLIVECLSGFVLFSRTLIRRNNEPYRSDSKVSVIIPARNEEKNLPHILQSLKNQTFKPHEIIVVDDFSEDKTKEIALENGVKLIENTQMPPGWTGKTWAVWNGFLNSSGDILVFLDADVRLAPDGLEMLLKTRERSGGVISVVPYHHTVKFYEKFALILNILGVFAFTSPFEKNSPEKGLYGSCIVAAREDYERVKGHDGIKSEIMDDLNLGKEFSKAGIKVENFIGYGMVSFRMYPYGLVSEIQGFSKGTVLGAATLKLPTILFTLLWVLGLIKVGFVTPFLLLANSPLAAYFVVGYLLYLVQILYFQKYVGRFGKIMPILHFLPSLFFILVALYSLYQVKILGHVTWKGRQIKVRK